jgi:hypothetical protein
MVPDLPSPSRRQLLGTLAGLTVGGGTVAVGATEPTALPDVLTDEATKHYPTPPEVNDLWRATVTEAHACEAVELLADTVSRGKRLWEQTDTDDHFIGAGGWLENARESLNKEKYAEALFDAGYGLQFAAEDLGVARARLGKANVARLAERANELLDRADAVVADMQPYPTREPGRDLAWYYTIERQIMFGRFNVDRDWREAVEETDDGTASSDSEEYDPRDIGVMTANLLEGTLHVRSAERYRDRLAEMLENESNSGGTEAYGEHLRRVSERFRSEIESLPERSEIREEFIDDTDDHGPYYFARSRLASWCFDYNYRFGLDEGTDLRVYETVSLSKGLAQRRAHEFALDNLVVETGQDGFDSGHTLAEKRRARSVYRDNVGSDPPPLLTRQIARAVEDLQVAKVGFAGNYQRPLWRERLKAYLYALVGRAKLREYPAVYDAIVEK